MQLIYVTSNAAKYNQAKLDCSEYGIEIVQDASHDFVEIQSESGEEIARHKATTAFELLQKPLVISDDSWSIPGLGGFPGAYMKSMNHWFTAEDWLRLTASLTDRRIILKQVIIYQDTDGQKVFRRELPGLLMKEIRGKSPHPHSTITSLDGGKTTTAMWHERGESDAQGVVSPWHDFAAWYTKAHAKD